jgi:hypothetical protein
MADGGAVASTASRALTFARKDQAVAARVEPRRAALVALVPIGVFLAFAAVRVAGRPRLNFDERIFLDVGRHIVDTGLPLRAYAQPGAPRLFFDHTPVYVYFVALVTSLGGPTELLARAASLVLGVLTVVLVFRIALEVRGLGAALVGSLLVAANPFFVTYSWFVRMEVPLCFCLVLALYLMLHERYLLAGLAIATAVMLKEVALAFWLVAVAYVVVRRGLRSGLVLAIPTGVAFAAWLVYANEIGQARLILALRRWLGSAGGVLTRDPRIHVGLRTWVDAVLERVIGPIMIFAGGSTAALVAIRRGSVPAITVVPVAYVAVAIAASFVISLKEPRFVVAIVPMIAMSIALLVDWDDIWAEARHRWAGPRGDPRVVPASR